MLYDVLVVGSGIAGLSSAIEAKKAGLNVAVMIKGNPLRSNSSMASGGINGVLYDDIDDSVNQHIEDTIKGADGIGDRESVERLCKNAKDDILWLSSIGVEFDKDEKGRISQRGFGGTSKKRTCYIQDKTGAAIVQTLIQKCNKMGIQCLKDYFLLNIIHDNDRVAGVTALRKKDSEVVVVVAKSVILAGGGFAGIYRGYSSNPQDTCGDTIASAIRASIPLMDMEFVQFHPTGLKHSGALISEAARGEGGYLINSKNERFISELATRDRVTRAIIEQFKNGCEVFLDIRHLGANIIDNKLPSLKRACVISEGVDPVTELIPIRPVAHYTMGGIEINSLCETKMKGLFACGENGCNGLHGANRLGGNSLLDALVFGKIAGINGTKYAKMNEFSKIDYKFVEKDVRRVEYIFDGENRYNINALRKNLGNMMFDKVGVIRDEKGLIEG
ncbi:MAG: FAD-dependent oxidoreductase, partial [Campylobacterales bacterium]|nr:FAD-dependent oxidoreductase [Campylobacterales bacterium]